MAYLLLHVHDCIPKSSLLARYFPLLLLVTRRIGSVEDKLHSVESAAQYPGGLSKYTIHAWLSSGKLQRTALHFRSPRRRGAPRERSESACDPAKTEGVGCSVLFSCFRRWAECSSHFTKTTGLLIQDPKARLSLARPPIAFAQSPGSRMSRSPNINRRGVWWPELLSLER
jgi:hypothetical protein